jgi:hypothetical protein
MPIFVMAPSLNKKSSGEEEIARDRKRISLSPALLDVQASAALVFGVKQFDKCTREGMKLPR